MSPAALADDLSPQDRGSVARSLELVAERCPDLTGPVYERLFSRHPQMQPLFVRDANGAVKGEMLAKVFEVILDLVDANRYAANMVRCEVITHQGYGVPADVFPMFFEVTADVIGERLGDDWTPDMARAWGALLDRLRTLAWSGG